MYIRGQLFAGRLKNSTLLHFPCSTRAYATVEPLPPPEVKNPLRRKRGGDLGSHLPKHVIPQDAYIPDYPYGARALYKQSNTGLYGDSTIYFGNNVSHKTETKTRRNWKPNVLSKSLYSVVLKKRIKMRVTSKVLKIIDREGGLDEYLLKDSETRIKELGPLGWALRWTLMQRPEVIERLRTQAAALGIDQAIIDKQWPTPAMLAEEKAARKIPFAVELFEETEDQEMWEPIEEDMQEDEQVSFPNTRFRKKQEKRIAEEAATEYKMAISAAKRYLDRGHVDSETQAIKLAFARTKDREEARASLSKKFNRKITEIITAQDLKRIRVECNAKNMSDKTAKQIAYNQWRARQIEKAGGYEAWRDSLRSDAAKEKQAQFEATTDPETWKQERRATFSSLIHEAEQAAYKKDLEDDQKRYFEVALRKADWAIKARASGGVHEYVASVLEEFRSAPYPSTVNLESMNNLKQATAVDGDAWGELVRASNNQVNSRPRA